METQMIALDWGVALGIVLLALGAYGRRDKL